ncbi:DUF3467 domain-containing protein [Rhodobaculum claviforme]|uniref:DUF3467 domain-containing protein n=1 Tax=Rhodobaculum claviforme TaxID=1549854 RepID=A0A934WKB7_9RHOB|nr:DUF3467 domain-containing protein [Rhodobaculum claviforme]MBK5928393.1 hypothetical protein [Rhodobaculum claviforme]
MARTPEATAAPGAAGASGDARSAQPGGAAATARANQVKFDTTDLKSSYCNVCNGSSTREEVVLNFGVNSTWDLGRDRLEVQLQHRIVMSPHAAKRVRDMMVRLIEEHESRYGKLDG